MKWIKILKCNPASNTNINKPLSAHQDSYNINYGKIYSVNPKCLQK